MNIENNPVFYGTFGWFRAGQPTLVENITKNDNETGMSFIKNRLYFNSTF